MTSLRRSVYSGRDVFIVSVLRVHPVCLVVVGHESGSRESCREARWYSGRLVGQTQQGAWRRRSVRADLLQILLNITVHSRAGLVVARWSWST